MTTTYKWRLTAHALTKVTERHGVNRAQAQAWTNERMETAEYVCNMLSDDGNYCRMFNAKGIVFYADLLDDVIVTTHKAQMPPPAAPVIAAAALRELRRKEIAVLKAEEAALSERTPLERESITLRLALARTRSEARRNALTARINAIESRMREISAGLTREHRELAQLARGYAAIK